MIYRLRTHQVEAMPVIHIIMNFPQHLTKCPKWIVRNFEKGYLKFDSGGNLYWNDQEMLSDYLIVKNTFDEGVYPCHSGLFFRMYEQVKENGTIAKSNDKDASKN